MSQSSERQLSTLDRAENRAGDSAQAAGNMLAEVFKSHPQEKIARASEQVVHGGELVFSNIWDSMESGAKSAASVLGHVIEGAGTAADRGLTSIGDAVESTANFIGSAIENSPEDLQTAAQMVGGAIIGGVQYAEHAVARGELAVANGVGDFRIAVVNGAENVASAVVNNVENFGSALVKDVENVGHEIAHRLAIGIETIGHEVASGAHSLGDVVEYAADRAGHTIDPTEPTSTTAKPEDQSPASEPTHRSTLHAAHHNIHQTTGEHEAPKNRTAHRAAPSVHHIVHQTYTSARASDNA